MISTLNDFEMDDIREILNEIYNSGSISEDLTKSILVALPKVQL